MPPRIVSLLPSATEIVCALGLGDQLVAVSHGCDFPPEVVRDLPVVTSSVLDPEGDEGDDAAALSTASPADNAAALSAGDAVEDADDAGEAGAVLPTARAIDERVREARTAGESLYRIDIERLRALKPDLLLTQGLCDVCAVSHEAVVAAVGALGDGVRVLDLAPTTPDEVLHSIREVGAAAGREAEAAALAEQMRARWNRVRERAAAAAERPRTLLLEWPDPPFSAGHWNPELLAWANGIGGPWDEPGKPSRTLTWDEIAAFAPEMLVLIACGFDADRAVEEAQALSEAPGWFDLPAVRSGECYAVDGNAYFNRPGPRLAESAEILATVLHPETFTEMLPPYAVRRFPNALLEPETP